MDLLRQEAPDLLGSRAGASAVSPSRSPRPGGRPDRDDDPRAAVRRRRHRRRRPAGHRGLPGRPPADREGLQDRRALRGRDRRGRRAGDRDGPPVPDGARALREGGGRRPLARGQGEQARPDDPDEPPDGDAGPRGRAHLRRLRPAPRRGTDLQLRRHGGPVRGDRLRGDRVGRQGRAHHAQEAVPDRGVTRRRAPLGGRGARRRGGGGRRDGRARLHLRDLPDREGRSPAPASRRSPRPRCAPSARPWWRRAARDADRCRFPTTSRPSR